MTQVLCLIPPRADGTVKREFQAGKGKAMKVVSYVFEPDAEGCLLCDVDNPKHLEEMLKDRASFIRVPAGGVPKPAEPDDGDDDDDDDGEDDGPAANDGAEAPRRKGGRKKKNQEPQG